MTNGTEGIRKQASELIEQAYQRGYKVGKDEAYKSPLLTKDAYMQGLNDAWNAMQKFYEMSNADMESIGLPVNDMVSPHSNIYYILQNISVNEAFDLIRAYEGQKKQKEDSEIRVGDEVTDGNGIKGVVVGAFRNSFGVEYISVLGTGEDFEVPQVMPREDYKKTGRHFPEIAEVLKKLKEGE